MTPHEKADVPDQLFSLKICLSPCRFYRVIYAADYDRGTDGKLKKRQYARQDTGKITEWISAPVLIFCEFFKDKEKLPLRFL